MSDKSDDQGAETPMQRALRMKKAAAAAKPPPPAGSHSQRQAAGVSAGASRPWMKK